MDLLMMPLTNGYCNDDTVSCTFSYHTWHFIIFTIFTITASVFSYSLSVSFWTQDLALTQILSSIDLFLYYWTDYMDYRTIYDFTLLNGCTGKCVRLSRLLAFECTLNHCTFISFHDPAWPIPFSAAVSVRPDQWCLFCTPSFAVFPTCCNQIQIWRIWRRQLRWDGFWDFCI